MSSNAPLLPAVAAGVALGLLFTLSPLSVLVTIAFALVLRRFAGTLPADERWWFVRVFGLAMAMRLAAIAVLFLVSAHDAQGAGILFGDEAYALARSWRIRNVVIGIPQLKYDYMIAYEGYGRNSYLSVMTFLQVMAGPSPYGLRVLNAAFFLGAVMLLFRVTKRAFGRLVAFTGSIVLLFLPTLFAWSISLLKESFYFLLTVSVFAAVVEIVGPSSWRIRGVCAAAAIAALLVLGDLRQGAIVLAVVGIIAGLASAYVLQRRTRIAIVLATLLAGAAAALAAPSARARGLTLIAQAATANAGHVFTVGHGYKLLDEDHYVIPGAAPRFELSVPEAGRYLVRAASSYLLVPLPWQMETRGELVYLPEQLLWYTLLLLAPIGMIAAIERDRMVASLLVAYVLPTAAVVALTTGNVGTLIRHRTLIVPFVVWVGAIGFASLVQRLIRRQEAAA
jgi:hypothetical protein